MFPYRSRRTYDLSITGSDALPLSHSRIVEDRSLRTFARKISNIDFFLKILPLKGDELVMSEM